MLLSKELTKQLVKLEPKTLENVPGLDCDVRIRHLTGAERLDYFSKTAQSPEEDMISGIRRMVDLVIMSVIDVNDQQIYTDDDFELVVSLNLRGLRHIATAATELNGFLIEDSEENS